MATPAAYTPFRAAHPRLKHGIGVVVSAVREPTLLGDNIIAIPYDLA